MEANQFEDYEDSEFETAKTKRCNNFKVTTPNFNERPFHSHPNSYLIDSYSLVTHLDAILKTHPKRN